jgi:hypothetical protein
MELGQIIFILLRSHSKSEIEEAISKLNESLENCDLPNTATATRSLRSIKELRYRGPAGEAVDPELSAIRAFGNTLRDVAFTEAHERLLLVVDKSAVTSELRQLDKTLTLTPIQQQLLLETIACLERHALRAALVMSWNMFFEIVRQWIFDKDINCFNRTLEANYRTRAGTPVYDAINNYDEFSGGAIGERVVIDTASDAGFFGARIRDAMRQYLRRRNDFAHPSFKSLSKEQVNAFVKDLIDILTDEPFIDDLRAKIMTP